MWNKVFLSISLIIILVIGIELFNNSQNQKNTQENNIQENQTQLSSTKYVKDDCINEWSDYATTVQEEIKETSESLNDENRHYILRAEDNIINIYYINENQEEILYRVTDISTEYLGEEDIKNLNKGIDVYGIQNLNQLIEDFE